MPRVPINRSHHGNPSVNRSKQSGRDQKYGSEQPSEPRLAQRLNHVFSIVPDEIEWERHEGGAQIQPVVLGKIQEDE